MILEKGLSDLETIKALLELRGHKTATAESRDEALSLAGREPFDLIIIGQELIDPAKGDKNFFKELNNLSAKEPSVLIMASDSSTERIEGADGCLTKPFTVESMYRSVDGLLSRPKVKQNPSSLA